MKLLVFLLLISSTIFSQECKVVLERFYEYKISKNVIITKDYDIESEVAFNYIQEGKYIQITTDRGMNWYLSDTLTKQFLKGREIKQKSVDKVLSYMVHNITIDSNTNLLYKEIENTCSVCRTSIYDMLVSDTSLIREFNSEGVKKIIVNYVQVRRDDRFGYIYVTIQKRFRRDEEYLFFEGMNE
jgi:hypothetical protein